MTKKYCPQFLLLLFFLPVSVFAQHTLQGSVLDANEDPIGFANVVLFNAQDSTTVYRGAVTSEEGLFEFSEVEENEYLLKVSFVGFEDYSQRIEVSRDKILPAIVLPESTANLDEVAINYISPTVKREIDRIVFNVENSSLSTGTTWDILKKTPGVIVANNALQVRNQGVQVYINDRKVHLSSSELQTLLENYSAENITSVEVIMNPPARYDAEGGAILNIITSKSIAPGYKGNVNGSYTQAIFPKFSLGTSHFYKTEKVDFFGSYTFSPRKEFKEDISYINFMNNGEQISRWETDFDRTTRSAAHTGNIIMDYNLSENDILSFSSSLTISPNKTFDNNVLTDIQNGPANDGLDYFLTDSELEEDLFNLALDLEYSHEFETGSEFSAKTHFTRFSQDRLQDVSTRLFGAFDGISENNFYTNAAQEINIFVAQLDYTSLLGSWKFNSGAKSSIINSLSGINFFQGRPGAGVFDPQLSDNFKYEEDIYAGYFSLGKDWEKWSLKGGLRGEITDRRGFSEAMQQEDTREHFDLFPTFYLQHTPSLSHSFTFDYSRRIQRPLYDSLNPFRYFLNEYDFNAGNPDLQASLSHNFNFNYTYNSAWFFDLYYRDNGSYPETLSFQDNENFTIRRVSMNVLESHSYGLDMSHGRNLKSWWYFYGYASLFHEDNTFLAVESNNAEVTNETDAFLTSLYNSFILSKDGTFSGELTFLYISDFISGSYNLGPMTTLSIGLRKTLWNNRAEVTLNFEDILDETNTWLRSDYLNQDNGFFAQPESRYVRVGFKYNFGNFRLSDNQRAIDAAERERL